MTTSTQQAAHDALVEAERIVKRSGTSFYWAMRLLPVDKRNAMYAVYAFCREVDDIADDPGKPDEKAAALQQWRAEIDRVFDANPATLVGTALLRPVSVYGLRKQDFIAVIEGMEMDARDKVRIRDMDELLFYCDRVACAVGRLSNRIFGVVGEMADEGAKILGEALQLTNILRDVADDAAINRVYLPADRLAAAGVNVDSPADLLRHSGIKTVCDDLAVLAGQRFDQAANALAESGTKDVKPAVIMMHMYKRIYDRLLARGFDDVTHPVRLSKAEKLIIAIRYGIFGP